MEYMFSRFLTIMGLLESVFCGFAFLNASRSAGFMEASDFGRIARRKELIFNDFEVFAYKLFNS